MCISHTFLSFLPFFKSTLSIFSVTCWTNCVIVTKLTGKLHSATYQVKGLSLLAKYFISVPLWLSHTRLLKYQIHISNSFALLKHVVTRRYSLTSVILFNVKSHFRLWSWLWALWFLYVFPRPLNTFLLQKLTHS